MVLLIFYSLVWICDIFLLLRRFLLFTQLNLFLYFAEKSVSDRAYHCAFS